LSINHQSSKRLINQSIMLSPPLPASPLNRSTPSRPPARAARRRRLRSGSSRAAWATATCARARDC
jgi:hypothetical protein